MSFKTIVMVLENEGNCMVITVYLYVFTDRKYEFLIIMIVINYSQFFVLIYYNFAISYYNTIQLVSYDEMTYGFLTYFTYFMIIHLIFL